MMARCVISVLEDSEMKKRIILLLLLLIGVCGVFVTIQNIDQVSASMETTEGIYTHLEFTDEFFPEYEDFKINFHITKTPALELNRSWTLYMTGYRIVLNDTLLAYIDHSDDILSYIPVLEQKELVFDADDLELNTTDLNYEHILKIQISAIALTENGDSQIVPDDYLTEEVFFLREATGSEIRDVALIVFVPLLIVTGLFGINWRINETSFENIKYRNMFWYLFKRVIIREDHTEETIQSRRPKTKPPATDSTKRLKKAIKYSFVFYGLYVLLSGLSFMIFWLNPLFEGIFASISVVLIYIQLVIIDVLWFICLKEKKELKNKDVFENGN